MRPANSSSSDTVSIPGFFPLLAIDSWLWTAFIYAVLASSFIFPTLLIYRAVKRDYEAFLALGPGGTTYSFGGYSRLAFIKLFRIRNPYTAPQLSPRLRPEHGFLRNLPTRSGQRPQLVGVAPQRQLTQKASSGMVAVVQQTMRGLTQECPSHWFIARSAFEKHSDALFSRYKTFAEPDYYGEIVHVHSSDGSMHLTLHPQDVRVVLEMGWGERHPLAHGRTWWWHSPVPRGFMIVYAPRDRAEVQAVEEIMRAAAWWVSGVGKRKIEEKIGDAKVKKAVSSPLPELEKCRH